MKFFQSASILLSLSTISLASPVAETINEALIARQSNDVASIVANVEAGTRGLTQLNQTLNRLKPRGGNIGAVIAIVTGNAVTKDLLAQSIRSIKSGPTSFSVAGSKKINDAGIDLARAANQTYKNLVSKRTILGSAVFGFGDIAKTVYDGLQSQRAQIVEFDVELEKRLAEPYASSLADDVLALTDPLDDALAAYKTCLANKICLPIISISSI